MSDNSDILTREVLIEKSGSHSINFISKKISDQFFNIEIFKIGKWHIFFQWSKVVATRTFGSDTIIVRALAIQNCETINTPYHWGHILISDQDMQKNWFNHRDKNKIIRGFFFNTNVIPQENVTDFLEVFKQHLKFFYKKDVQLEFPHLQIRFNHREAQENLSLAIVSSIGSVVIWEKDHKDWMHRDKLNFLKQVKQNREDNGILHTDQKLSLAIN